ncbi:MAG: ATP-grasp domain-containing protein [Candidatus Nanohaloarchaea archaeon]|nr:ATP-grasp domain-containing protein [Candidatus Nanohaloarchaea archaeon]
MRIGVASTDRQGEEDAIMAELADRGIDATFIDPSDVSYLVKDAELTVRYHGEMLNDLDLLFMRRTRFDVEASRDLVAAMDTLGVRTVERTEVFFNPLSKFYSLLDFVGEDVGTVRIPATAVLRDDAEAGAVAGAIGYPLIVKPVGGREGEGVTRLDSREELEEALDGADFPVLLQEYIDIDEEYRVLVVGDEVLGTVVKEAADDDTAARNYAQGAEFHAVDRPDIEAAAVDIARLTGIEVAGVDIVQDASGDYYELECNRCPQFEGFAGAHPDVDVPARIVDYLVEQASA